MKPSVAQELIARAKKDAHPQEVKLIAVGGTSVVVRIGEDMAVKMRRAQDVSTEHLQQEAEAQKHFRPFSPEIFGFTRQKGVAAIAMERVDTTLDQLLTEPLTMEKLRKVVADLSSIFAFMVQRKLTHGDLALFNIGVRAGTLCLIDFDRASHTVYRPRVDILRIMLECHPDTRSQGTPELDEWNMLYLRNYGVPKWRSIFREPYIPISKIKDAWSREYDQYMELLNM